MLNFRLTAPFHANVSVAEKSNASSSLVLVWCIGLSWRLVCGWRKHSIIYQLSTGILSYSSFSRVFFILFRTNTCKKTNQTKNIFLCDTKEKNKSRNSLFLAPKIALRWKIKHKFIFCEWKVEFVLNISMLGYFTHLPRPKCTWKHYDFVYEGRFLMWLTPTTLVRFFWTG